MCAIVSVGQLKLSFSNTCQMTVKLLVLHLFPVPQTGSYNNKSKICDGKSQLYDTSMKDPNQSLFPNFQQSPSSLIFTQVFEVELKILI